MTDVRTNALTRGAEAAAPPDEDAVERDLPYWVALHRVHRLGSVRCALLEAAFPSLEAAWHASRAEPQAAGLGLDARTARAIEQERDHTTPSIEVERLAAAGITPSPARRPPTPSASARSATRRRSSTSEAPSPRMTSGAWPSSEPAAPPPTAAWPPPSSPAASPRTGVTVVSGLARGVDAIAHRTALDSRGRTMAVLASGLDTIYPPENAAPAREIVERGALVSDYPPDTKPRAEFFPRRNPIMSVISLGTMVIEGDFTSGAMITARFATEQNREVFAVPGFIFSPQSRGPNSLIKDGATPISSADDVLEALNLTTIGAQMDFGRVAPPASEEERALMSALSREPRHIDEVVRASGLAAGVVSGTLALLELKGLVRNVGAMQYARVREHAADYDVEPTHEGDRSAEAPRA